MNRDNADGEFDRNNYIETSIPVRDWLPMVLALLIVVLAPNGCGLLIAILTGTLCALILYRERHP